MFGAFIKLFRKPKVIYRIENKKANMCYKICYRMKSDTGGFWISSREFVLPDDIINNLNNGYNLESVELRDYNYNIISTGNEA